MLIRQNSGTNGRTVRSFWLILLWGRGALRCWYTCHPDICRPIFCDICRPIFCDNCRPIFSCICRPDICRPIKKKWKFSHVGRVWRSTWSLHTGERPSACELCAEAFSGGNNSKMHMKVHAGGRPYQSLEAPQAFPQRREAQRVTPHERKACVYNVLKLILLKTTWTRTWKMMMVDAGWKELCSKYVVFQKLAPLCMISCLFNSSILIKLEPQLTQIGANLLFFPPRWWPYACAGLKLERIPFHIFCR